MALEIVPPPLTLSSSRTIAETVDWDTSSAVDPQHIADTRALIEDNFPRLASYPSDHLKCLLYLGPWGSSSSEDVVRRYNPYSLRLPLGLHAYDYLFDRKKIASQSNSYLPPGMISREAAECKYLNFIREYYLLYLDMLEAVNGSGSALVQITKKVTTNQMYDAAGIETTLLKKEYPVDNASITFRKSCIAYIAIDVLRSPRPEIGTAARVRVLNMLRRFNVDDVASAFSENHLGFKLAYKDEPVEDLIPRSFMHEAVEKGGTPHNDLFFKNAKVQKIFEIRQDYGSINERINFDVGVATLLQRHPAEAVQTLLSVMRSDDISRKLCKLAFHALVSFSNLDGIQKGELFGAQASYRVDGQRARLAGLQSRVGATTGVSGSFGEDGLDLLSAEALRIRLRQVNNYVDVLEEKLVRDARCGMEAPGASTADPKGYFAILGLDPTASDIDILVHACYRTLARKKHPDKGGNTEDFKALQKAYEILREPNRRQDYLNSG